MTAFLGVKQAEELRAYCASAEDDAAAGRYLKLRMPADVKPFTHAEAMKLLSVDISAHYLLLAKRTNVTVSDWVEASDATTNDGDLLLRYFELRVASQKSHQEALTALEEEEA